MAVADAAGHQDSVSGSVSGSLGLLCATMEPPDGLGEEFNNWYDFEHLPERADTSGFLNAERFICIEGWPRYLALYDLRSVNVLHGEAYMDMVSSSTSRWPARLMPRVAGLYRAEGRQIYPGNARLGDRGTGSRLALWRFRNVDGSCEPEIVGALREAYEHLPQTLQLRVFRAEWAEGADLIALVELSAPVAAHGSACEALGDHRRLVDMCNNYVRYARDFSRTPVKPSP